MSDNMRWSPREYLKFGDLRLRPALDLIEQIPIEAPAAVYDLGCGPGNITRMLAERWPGAKVTGIDTSPEMLAKAAEVSSDVSWVEDNIADFDPAEPGDVIFSNAALHWLDDHASLFPGLFSHLNPGGVLAVQMPCNHASPSHVLLAETARSGPWRDLLEPLLRPSPVANPDFYYDLLATEATAINIWESEYTQILDGDNPVLEWVRGTALKPLLDAFDKAGKADWKEAFIEEYSTRLNEAYPQRRDGRTLFPFRRIFVIART